MVRARPQQIPPSGTYSKAATERQTVPHARSQVLDPSQTSRVSTLFKLCGPRDVKFTLDTSALLLGYPSGPWQNEALKQPGPTLHSLRTAP